MTCLVTNTGTLKNFELFIFYMHIHKLHILKKKKLPPFPPSNLPCVFLSLAG